MVPFVLFGVWSCSDSIVKESSGPTPPSIDTETGDEKAAEMFRNVEKMLNDAEVIEVICEAYSQQEPEPMVDSWVRKDRLRLLMTADNRLIYEHAGDSNGHVVWGSIYLISNAKSCLTPPELLTPNT